jgi:5-keto 4-deoxyuronate isomerase
MAERGRVFKDGSGTFLVRDLFNRADAHLDFLSASEISIENTTSSVISFPTEEVLLFNLHNRVDVIVDAKEYILEHFDVLYVTKGAGMQFRHEGNEPGHLYAYRALAEAEHPVFYSNFKKAKSDEARIRRLNRKMVYKMLDDTDAADKFMAGYTFYEDQTRAWPPHNHTDQEEVYTFIEGTGAMTVYEDDEHQTFVKSVSVGDHVTIPILNYHPVFSDDEPVAFIWCIAGERYWVGDKNTDFMKGDSEKITT